MISQPGRAGNARRTIVFVVVAAAAAYSVFRGSIDRVLTPPCTKQLELDAALPAEWRAHLEELQRLELVYCPPAPSGLSGFSGPVYWASDGVGSLLYYAFSPENPVNIGQYEFADHPVMPAGDAAPDGLKSTGRPAYRNEAPDGAPFYLVSMGAPRRSEVKVALQFRARGEPQTGLSNRNFWTDGMNVIRRLRHEPLTTENGRVALTFAIVPDRWAGVTSRWSDPELDPVGTGDFRQVALLDTPPELALARVVSGDLAAGAWVVGVVSATRPTLMVVPESGAPLPPVGFSFWRGGSGTLALFELPVLEAGVPYTFQIWKDGAEQIAGGIPDKVTEPIVLAKPTPDG